MLLNLITSMDCVQICLLLIARSLVRWYYLAYKFYAAPDRDMVK